MMIEQELFHLNLVKENPSEYPEKYLDIISYGKDLDFKFIDISEIAKFKSKSKSKSKSKLDFDKLFKFNFAIITTQLKQAFPEILFDIKFEAPSRRECEIKQYEHTVKSNVYIGISKNTNTYECGFDLVIGHPVKNNKVLNLNEAPENLVYNTISNEKYNTSKTFLDYYEYFILTGEEEDSFKDFMSECVFGILKVVCALNDDEYTLAEIMYMKSVKEQNNSNQKIIKKNFQIFKKIIGIKKENKINFKDIFDEFLFNNPSTGENYEYDEFVEFLSGKINEFKFIDDSKEMSNYIDYDTFVLIILSLDSSNSIKLDLYKLFFAKATELLMKSLKMIVEMMKSINQTKKYIPVYIENFISNHLDEFNNKVILDTIYKKDVYNEKCLLDDILLKLTNYVETNEHDENKLDLIYFNFETFYSKIFGKLNF